MIKCCVWRISGGGVERELREAGEMLDHHVAIRPKKLQQANARLEEEIERRRRTEALLRDALEQGQEDLRFRDFLIREVNHLTKNALQARHSDDPACCSALESATGRLQRIAGVHALLTYRGEARDTINLSNYLNRICREMAETPTPHRRMPRQPREKLKECGLAF
jgi:two-component sensor histidine kinase